MPENAFRIVDLTPYFNNDGISYDHDISDGDLDGEGHTFPAEDLPESNTVFQSHGVDFLFPDKSDGRNNNITLAGQRIRVPQGRYAAAHFLGCAEWGSFEEEILFCYNNGSKEQAILAFTNFYRHPDILFGEKPALRCSGEYSVKYGDVHTRVVNSDRWIWHQTLPIDPKKILAEIVLSDNPSMHLFALTLEKV